MDMGKRSCYIWEATRRYCQHSMTTSNVTVFVLSSYMWGFMALFMVLLVVSQASLRHYE